MSSLLRLACRMGILIQPIRSTTQICLVTRHQYGISTLVSFGGETSGSVLGHEVFSPERSLNQPKAKRVCIRSINQSNRFISVCCFCFVRAFSLAVEHSGTWNMEHSGTCRNIPEHSGTSRNIPEHEKIFKILKK